MKQKLKKYTVEFDYTTYHEIDGVQAVSPQGALELVNEKLWESKKEDVKKFLDETIVDDEEEYQHSAEFRVLEWADPEAEYIWDLSEKPDLVALQRSHLEDQNNFNCELPFFGSRLLLNFLEYHLGTPESQGSDWYEGAPGLYYELSTERDEYIRTIKLMFNTIRKEMDRSTPEKYRSGKVG